jgi:hypothetical protein
MFSDANLLVREVAFVTRIEVFAGACLMGHHQTAHRVTCAQRDTISNLGTRWMQITFLRAKMATVAHVLRVHWEALTKREKINQKRVQNVQLGSISQKREG